MKLRELKELICVGITLMVLNEAKTCYKVKPYSITFAKYENYNVCGIIPMGDGIKIGIIK